MTSGLRKAHTYIWLFLIIIVPVIIIFSIKDLAIFSSEDNSDSIYTSSKKGLLKISENDFIKVSVYEGSIKIILQTTLKNASSVVYTIDSKGNKSEILGQLTTAGMYIFKTSTPPKGILIVDALKNTEITKLTF